MDKRATYLLESGPHSVTHQVQARGLSAVVVGRDGRAYDVEEWPHSATYRAGGQANLLVADNRTGDWERCVSAAAPAALARRLGASRGGSGQRARRDIRFATADVAGPLRLLPRALARRAAHASGSPSSRPGPSAPAQRERLAQRDRVVDRLRRGPRRGARSPRAACQPSRRPRSACRSRQTSASPATTSASVSSARAAHAAAQHAVAAQQVAAAEAGLAALGGRAAAVGGRAEVHADRVGGLGGGPAGGAQP